MSPLGHVGVNEHPHGLLLPFCTRCPFVADKALRLVAIAHVEYTIRAYERCVATCRGP
jgi:hypothetical protein